MYRSVILIFFALFYALSLPAQSVDGLRVAWDRSSESKIAPHGNYARVIRLEDGAFLAAYEHGGSICLSASEDLMSWSSPRPVVSGFHGKADGKDYHVHTANPELCLTEEGTLLLAFNYRPSGLAYFPFSIAVCSSTDNAVTWSSPDVVYSAGTDFQTAAGNRPFYSFLIVRFICILQMRDHIPGLRNRKSQCLFRQMTVRPGVEHLQFHSEGDIVTECLSLHFWVMK